MTASIGMKSRKWRGGRGGERLGTGGERGGNAGNWGYAIGYTLRAGRLGAKVLAVATGGRDDGRAGAAQAGLAGEEFKRGERGRRRWRESMAVRTPGFRRAQQELGTPLQEAGSAPEPELELETLEAKTESFLVNRLEPHWGQTAPSQRLVRTRISLSASHFSQWNS